VKIAIVHPFAWPEVRRGGERYLDDLAWYLRGAGHDVDVIAGTEATPGVTPVTGGRDIRLHQLPDLTIHRAHVKVRAPESFGVRAFPVLARRRYDVVHALMPTSALAAVALRQRTVMTFLGYPSEELFRGHPAKRRLFLATMRTAQAVTALSEQVADEIEATWHKRPLVVPPGVRTAGFAPAPRSATPTILFASAMRPEKGVDVLLRAFGLLAARRADVRLVLSGPGDTGWAYEAAGPALDPYRSRIDEIGVGDPADLPGLYASAHVTVLPSRQEAFGLVLAESLASGTPIVGCRNGGADDIVSPEVGRIVDHGNAEQLATAIEEVLDLAAAPGIAARCVERAALWDWTTSVGPLHERLYESVS
jgi:glycosyltransferase involved in cell wall biosynthesis